MSDLLLSPEDLVLSLEGQAFHERCEAAIGKVAMSPALVSQWRACATRWGPMSPAALGVLEALAGEAWAPYVWDLTVDEAGAEFSAATLMIAEAGEGAKAKVLLAALEAAHAR